MPVDIEKYGFYKDRNYMFNIFLFNYYKDLSFFDISKKKVFLKSTKNFSSVPALWYHILGNKFHFDRELGPEYDERNFCQSRYLLELGDKIRIRNVNITDWVPISPGMAYTRDAHEVMKETQNRIIADQKRRDEIDANNEILDDAGFIPHIFTLRLCCKSGDCSIRLDIHNDLKLLSFGTNCVYQNVPLIVTRKVWQYLEPEMKKNGTVHVDSLKGTVTKYDTSIYDHFNDVPVNGPMGPLFDKVIFIEKIGNIKGIGTPEKVKMQPWNFFSKPDLEYPIVSSLELGSGDYDLEFDEQVKLIHFYANIIKRNSKPIFQIDEVKPRFTDPAIRIRDIVQMKDRLARGNSI